MNSLPTQPASLSQTAPIASRAGVRIAELGVFLMTALVVSMPSGLLPFGVCLLLGSLVGWRNLRAGIVTRDGSLRALGWLTAAVIAMSLLSIALFEHGLRDVDNRSRFLVLPWAALWAYALQPRQVWLWRGALAGVFAAMLIALLQVMNGADRAEGFTNAIVFADITLMLLVVAVFCRPVGNVRWLVGAAIAAVVVIVLSGSRGVYLSLLVTLGVLIWGAAWHSPRMRLLAFIGSGVLAVGVIVSVPALTDQMRLGELQRPATLRGRRQRFVCRRPHRAAACGLGYLARASAHRRGRRAFRRCDARVAGVCRRYPVAALSSGSRA